MTRALLLDFGGTLAIERSPRASIYADAAASSGVEVSPAAMSGLMAETHESLPITIPTARGDAFRYSRGWFERFIEIIFAERLGLSSTDTALAQEHLFSVYEDARTFRLFPGAADLIDRARADGWRVGVVSNWSYALEALLGDLGLQPDAVLCSAVEGAEKPSEVLFLRALDRLEASAEGSLHVGDSFENDVLGARSVGIEPVLLDRSRSGTRRDVLSVRCLTELRL
ncbi:MAG: HAD-IA family hydrolase [Planctomycetota bacterium]|nr:HAD-IA family hydrolase [Planctomycetota bacterium]